MLTLIYLTYTNTERNWRKTILTHLWLQEDLTFYIYTSDIKGKNAQTYPIVELQMYYFMDRQLTRTF